MTQQEHDELEKYAKTRFNSIFREKNIFSSKTHLDLFYDAFLKKPEDLKKQIVREIYDHFYETLAKAQRLNGFVFHEKQCTCCKKNLLPDYFRIQIHKETGFKYLRSMCKKCEAISIKKYRENNKKSIAKTRRIYYENNKKREYANLVKYRAMKKKMSLDAVL